MTKARRWLVMTCLVASTAATPAWAQNAGTTFKDCAECPEMIRLPGGNFTMGSAKLNPTANSLLKINNDEQPQRGVTIKPFALGKYEVTQEQWTAIMGDNPSVNKGPSLPVDSVSWDDAQKFIQRLNARTGKTYRLPSEAEWEYAARAGSTTAYSFGDDPSQLDRYGWFETNSNGTSHPVGQKLPNKFGLYDMHGNVWEWTQDCYTPSYATAPRDGSAVKGAAGCEHVDRGGAWVSGPNNLRSANRDWGPPHYRLNNLGFRLARNLP